MESDNREVVNALADFVSYAFKRRESILAASSLLHRPNKMGLGKAFQ